MLQGPFEALQDKITVILSKTNKNTKRGEKMIFKVNDLFYICKVGRWREGFTHCVQVCNKFGEPLVRSCTKYYNRTWEKYHFQSAMMNAQRALERKFDRCKAGRAWVNYVWENWTPYDFENEPQQGQLN